MKKRAPRSTPHCLVELTKVDYARLRDNLIVLEGLHATEKEVDKKRFRQANYKFISYGKHVKYSVQGGSIMLKAGQTKKKLIIIACCTSEILQMYPYCVVMPSSCKLHLTKSKYEGSGYALLCVLSQGTDKDFASMKQWSDNEITTLSKCKTNIMGKKQHLIMEHKENIIRFF